ncbi:MAG: hypothetical protein HYZ29_20175 [Myxococcales bacterium]|nr:hypothetical protein [Myxococcales bacterium]
MRAARADGKTSMVSTRLRPARAAARPHRGETAERSEARGGRNALAESLLGNRYAEGTSIKVGLDGEKFTFTG